MFWFKRKNKICSWVSVDSLELDGYTKYELENEISYQKNYEQGGCKWKRTIIFWLKDKNYCVDDWCYDTKANYPAIIDLDENVSIKNVMKDLGWL